MDLIHHRGLNCHLSAIINLINLLEVNYLDAFSTLWSETDFTDEIKYNLYVSQNIFTNLQKIGIVIKKLNCDKNSIEANITKIKNDEFFVIGLDYYYIPWHPVSKHFHGPHYIFAQKKAGNSILGFDPIYNKKYIEINLNDILFSIFDIIQVYKTEINFSSFSLIDEAKRVLHFHPVAIKNISEKILKSENEGKRNLTVLIKQISAMINNRYLFQLFFNSTSSNFVNHKDFFNDAYFSKWEALKNGLYKAKIVKDNVSVINEVYNLFDNLMQEEITIAKQIIESI